MDMAAGESPKRTGSEQPEKGDEQRRLEQKVYEAKKKGGYHVSDPATQLRTAMDEVKARLTNQIADLAHQIATRKKIVKDKSPVTYDAEAEALRTQRDALREEYRQIFGQHELTTEQRIKVALQSTERSLLEYQRRIDERDFKSEDRAPLTSPELKAAQSRRDALKEEYTNLRNLDADYAARKAEETLVRKRDALEKSVAEKEAQLATGDIAPKPRAAAPVDPRLTDLTRRRDALNKAITEARKKPASVKYAENLAKRLETLNKAIAERKAKLASGDLSPDTTRTMNRPEPTPELEKARQELEELNRQIAEGRKAPRKSKDEISNQAYRTRVANRIADLTDRLARGDFEPRARHKMTMDEASLKAKTALESVNASWQNRLALERLKRRPRWEKTLDFVSGFRRFGVLTSPMVLPKLMSAGAQRLALAGIEDAIGGVWRHIPGIAGIAAQAPLEGAGLNVRAEMRGFGPALWQGMKDANNIRRTGLSELDVLHGKHKESYTGESNMMSQWLEIPGRIHGMIKAPVKRVAFERSAQRLAEYYKKQGLDVDSKVVQDRIAIEAYKAANRAIFLDDNRLASGINAAIARWEQVDRETGKPPIGGKIAATAAHFALFDSHFSSSLFST